MHRTAMREASICWWRIESCLIRLASRHRSGDFVVDFKDYAFCAVFAKSLFVFPFDDVESFEDVIGIFAGCAVEVEERGVELTSEDESAGFIPSEGLAEITAVGSEGA